MIRKIVCAAMLMSSCVLAQTTKPEIKTTLVTVKVTDAPLADAIQQIAQQAKIPIQLQQQGNRPPQSDARVTIDVTDQPLMSVLATLFRDGKCRPNPGDQRVLAMNVIPQPVISVELIDERTLLLINNVSMNGNTPVQPNGQLNYSYGIDCTLIFDPASKIVGVFQQASVKEIDAEGQQLQRQSFGNNEVNQTDGRRLGAYRIGLNLNTTSKIQTLKQLRAEARVVRVIEQADLELTGNDLLSGGSIESGGITLSTPPADPSSQNGITISLAGERIKKLQQANGWGQYLGGYIRVDGIDGPLSQIRTQQAPSPGGDKISYYVGAVPRGPIDPSLIETIKISVPLKVKDSAVPIVLNNVPLP